MIIRNTLIAAATALALLAASGCAVTRGQETTGAYIDDATITTQIKSRMLDNPSVAGTSISVETLKGTVMLSGFAKSNDERTVAESLAWKVDGVTRLRGHVGHGLEPSAAGARRQLAEHADVEPHHLLRPADELERGLLQELGVGRDLLGLPDGHVA